MGALLLSFPAFALALDALTISIAEVSHPALSAQEVQLAFAAGEGAVLRIGSLKVAGQHWRELSIDCRQVELSSAGVACARGKLRMGDDAPPLDLDFRFDRARGSGRLALADAKGMRLNAVLTPAGELRAELSEVALGALAGWLPMLEAWKPVGVFDGRVTWRARGNDGRLQLKGRLKAAGFSTVDGLRAGENLAGELAVDAARHGARWNWTTTLDWQAGATYWHPFYVESGMVAQARGSLEGDRLRVDFASLAMEGVAQTALSAVVDLRQQRLLSAALSVAGVDLAVVGPRWLAPLLAPEAGDRLRFAGGLAAGVRLEAGRLVGLDLVADDAGFSLAAADGGRGVAFGPVVGDVAWQVGQRARLAFRVEGGHWQQLALGAFEVNGDVTDEGLALDRLRIPVLDGALVFDGLSLRRESDAWIGRGALVVEPVSVPLLTATLGWPTMSGVLTAFIPGVRISPGEVALDGALVVSVFGGYLRATALRVREPFGVASHLAAELELRHLDLGQLTDTFSFGHVTGFIDADVRGLELVRWRPVRFDARVASSPGSYPRRISQRAVQNIGALGGEGAVVAVQRSLLSMFDTFGYRDIGLSCALSGNACVMAGLPGERADGGFVIVRGGGVPALDVIGYNRRVDWMELIERLRRVQSSNVEPVVR